MPMRDNPALAVDPLSNIPQREYLQQVARMPVRTPLVRYAENDFPLYQP